MQCNKCGFVLGPFDTRCPRCGQPAGAEAAAPPAAAPAPAGAAVPSAPPAAAPAPAGGAAPYVPAPARRSGMSGPAVLALVVLLAGGLIAGLVVVALKMAGGAGLRLVQSGPAGSLLQAPAVSADQIGQRLTAAGAATGGEIEVSLA